MARTLLRVPKMYTKEDLSRIDPRVPEDYDEKAEEFWQYVGERFSAISGRLKKIYLESTGVMGKRHLEMIKISDPRQHDVIGSALDSGAELLEAEDPELVLETLSWMQRMQELIATGLDENRDSSAIQAISEFLQDSMKERDEAVKKVISSTLQDGEVGALIMDTSREIQFPSDVRVVVTCPFQPRDYLNSWLAGLRAKDQAEAAKAKEEAEAAKAKEEAEAAKAKEEAQGKKKEANAK